MMKTLFHTPKFQTPDEVSLLEFFEAEPIIAPQEGFWCYEVTDSDETKLRFSFNTFERSVQTTLLKGERELMSICQEGAIRLTQTSTSSGPMLRGEFQYENARSTLEIRVQPEILVRWSTLAYAA